MNSSSLAVTPRESSQGLSSGINFATDERWRFLLVVGFSHPNPGHTEFLSPFHPGHFQQVCRDWAAQSATLLCRSVTEFAHHLSVTPLQPPLHCYLQTQLGLGSLSFLACRRSHQNLQEEVFSQMAAEDCVRSTQVNVTTVISNTLCRYFTLWTVG